MNCSQITLITDGSYTILLESPSLNVDKFVQYTTYKFIPICFNIYFGVYGQTDHILSGVGQRVLIICSEWQIVFVETPTIKDTSSIPLWSRKLKSLVLFPRPTMCKRCCCVTKSLACKAVTCCGILRYICSVVLEFCFGL